MTPRRHLHRGADRSVAAQAPYRRPPHCRMRRYGVEGHDGPTERSVRASAWPAVASHISPAVRDRRHIAHGWRTDDLPNQGPSWQLLRLPTPPLRRREPGAARAPTVPTCGSHLDDRRRRLREATSGSLAATRWQSTMPITRRTAGTERRACPGHALRLPNVRPAACMRCEACGRLAPRAVRTPPPLDAGRRRHEPVWADLHPRCLPGAPHPVRRTIFRAVPGLDAGGARNPNEPARRTPPYASPRDQIEPARRAAPYARARAASRARWAHGEHARHASAWGQNPSGCGAAACMEVV